jgi:hypothetical protein
MTDDLTFKRAVIERFNHAPRSAKDPYAFAMLCIFEVRELFRAMEDEAKPVEPVERESSERSKQIQIRLDILNRKADDTQT